MADIKAADVFSRLNSLGYKSLEGAMKHCRLSGRATVELAHFIHIVLQLQDSDLHRIIAHFELDHGRLGQDIFDRLEQYPGGALKVEGFAWSISEAAKEGWLYATLLFNQPQVRGGFLLIGVLKDDDLRGELRKISREFKKIDADELIERFADIVDGSPEDAPQSEGAGAGRVAPGEASGAFKPGGGPRSALAQFTVDLTEQARQGELDPIVGRDDEIRQVVDILMRRRQNNPILTGEAGVGKTAVVEGFALRIAAGDVPPPLREVELRVLDVGLLQAGASMKGEFEQRLRSVIDDVQASAKPTILFVDEAHTLIGAGGAAGTGDAANLLKPVLARGTLRTVAATTWAEYKKHIEKDPALTRRFQVVQIDEPSEDNCVLMMRSLAATMESHHQVQILDEALKAAVKLSHRYIPARQLPDKAVSLLDTACARVAISLQAVPATVDDSRRRIDALTTELDIIDKESAIGLDTAEREALAHATLDDARARLEELETRWREEQQLVGEILALRAKLRDQLAPIESTGSAPGHAAEKAAANVARGDNDAGAAPADRATLLAELTSLQQRLAELQGEQPLMLPSVDAQAVASVVADWTGIPVGRMVKDEIDTIMSLDRALAQRVIGQNHAMAAIARRLQTARAGLDNPQKPIGVFLLVGPSGVGKTETALALAESLYGGEQNVVTINMSEFQEAHTVSTLKGAPPGYVGYGEGGILTEAVRRKPYSVVLLDEVEKAHSDVHEIFFQVFDKGQMEDGEGRMIDFKNTLILLTSNVGSELIMNLCKDPDLMPESEGIVKALRESLLKTFPAALLGRLVVIPYYPLNDEMLSGIARLQLERIERRIKASHDINFNCDDAVVDLIVKRCTELESGGRMIDAILTNTLLPTISRELLTRLADEQQTRSIDVSVVDGDFSIQYG